MKRQVVALFIYLLIDIIAFASVLPLFPQIIESFSNNVNDSLLNITVKTLIRVRKTVGYSDTDKGINVLLGGFLGSVLCLFQFVFSPILGAMSDHFGRKPLLIFTSLGMLLAYSLWATDSSIGGVSYSVFLFTRILSGACRSNVAVAVAAMSDLYSESRRSAGMAVIGIAYSLGFIVGPLLGVTMASVTHVAVLCVTLVCLDIAWLAGTFTESHLPSKKPINVKSTWREIMLYLNPVSIFYYQPMKNLAYTDLIRARKLGFVYFIYIFIYSGIEFTLTFLTHTKFGFTSKQQGQLFVVVGVVMILVQGLLVRRIRNTGQEKSMVFMGFISLAGALVVLGCTNSVSLLWLGVFLLSVAGGSVVPCLTAMVLECDSKCSQRHSGCLMGILRAQGGLARTLGPLTSALLYWIGGGPLLAYFTGAALLIVPCLLLSNVTKTLG